MINKVIGLKVLILPLSIAFVVMFSVLFVKPAFDGMAKAKKEAALSQDQLASVKNQNQKLAELKSKWETLSEKELVQGALPDKEEVDRYMAELYGRVSRSGTLLTQFSAKENKGSSAEVSTYICGSESGAASGAGAAGTESATSATASPELSAVGALPASNSCVDSTEVAISASGSWDQILELFKYLEDTNRVANIKAVDIQSKSQSGQEGGSGDLLNVDVLMNIYYKQKSKTESVAAISSLAKSGSFSQESLKKLKSVVFSAFEEPGVSEVSERNIFK